VQDFKSAEIVVSLLQKYFVSEVVWILQLLWPEFINWLWTDPECSTLILTTPKPMSDLLQTTLSYSSNIITCLKPQTSVTSMFKETLLTFPKDFCMSFNIMEKYGSVNFQGLATFNITNLPKFSTTQNTSATVLCLNDRDLWQYWYCMTIPDSNLTQIPIWMHL